MKLNNGIRLTWLGHATYKIEAEGKTYLIDPWVDSNPVCPDELKSFDTLDVILITHGHWDHIEDAVPIAKKHMPTVVSIIEIAKWLNNQGVENTIGFNKGGTVTVEGVKATMVTANHSSSFTEKVMEPLSTWVNLLVSCLSSQTDIKSITLGIRMCSGI